MFFSLCCILHFLFQCRLGCITNSYCPLLSQAHPWEYPIRGKHTGKTKQQSSRSLQHHRLIPEIVRRASSSDIVSRDSGRSQRFVVIWEAIKKLLTENKTVGREMPWKATVARRVFPFKTLYFRTEFSVFWELFFSDSTFIKCIYNLCIYLERSVLF